MSKLLIGVAAMAIAGGALAQGMQPPAVQTMPMGVGSQSDEDGGRTQTRAEVIAKTQKHFAMMDANHDGFVTADEMQAMGGGHQMGKHMGHDGGEMGGMHGGGMGARMLKLADANNDGRISLQELTAASLQRFDRADTNHDGQLTQEERKAMRQQMKLQRGQIL